MCERQKNGQPATARDIFVLRSPADMSGEALVQRKDFKWHMLVQP
jgi:hypothetical protein